MFFNFESVFAFGIFLSNMFISQEPSPKKGQTNLWGLFLLPGDILLKTLCVFPSSLRPFLPIILPIKNYFKIIQVKAATPLQQLPFVQLNQVRPKLKLHSILRSEFNRFFHFNQSPKLWLLIPQK